jgi:hypothetical protein
LEGNYYANYLLEVSGCWGLGYEDFGELRGLTRDFAGVFGERKWGGGLGLNPHLRSEMWGTREIRGKNFGSGRGWR